MKTALVITVATVAAGYVASQALVAALASIAKAVAVLP